MWMLKVVVLLVEVAVNGISAINVGIVGGDEVEITQYPHQVSLIHLGRQDCGGSIISEKFVLTAANCIRDAPDDYKVRAGSTYRNEGGQVYDVLSLIVNPNFSQKTLDFDIGLVKVVGKINIDGVSTKVVKLALPGSKVKPGTQLSVTGWGDTNGPGTPSNVLRAGMVPAVNNEYCQRLWSGTAEITDRMLCAGDEESGPSPCNGDSGSPLIDSNFVQYGVVSFSAPGCRGKPSVFASLANLRSWIQENSGV